MYPTTSLVLCYSTTFPMLSYKFSLCHNQFDKNTHRYVFLSWITGIQVRSISFMYILIKYICMLIVDMQWNFPVPPIFISPSSTTSYNRNDTSFKKTNVNKTKAQINSSHGNVQTFYTWLSIIVIIIPNQTYDGIYLHLKPTPSYK